MNKKLISMLLMILGILLIGIGFTIDIMNGKQEVDISPQVDMSLIGSYDITGIGLTTTQTVYVYHDNKRSVTCYITTPRFAISCVPDAMINPKLIEGV